MKFVLSIIFLCFINIEKQVDNSLQTTELVSGLFAYTDYETGTAFAKKSQKPTLVYFRDRRSANCRKFEKSILSDDKIKNYISENFVLVSLLVDDNTQVTKPKTSTKTGKNLKTVGEINIDIEMSLFQSDGQPYSALIDKENKFKKGTGYISEPKQFLKFLKSGK